MRQTSRCILNNTIVLKYILAPMKQQPDGNKKGGLNWFCLLADIQNTGRKLSFCAIL